MILNSRFIHSRFYSNGISFDGLISYRTTSLCSHFADAEALDVSKTMTVNEGHSVLFHAGLYLEVELAASSLA